LKAEPKTLRRLPGRKDHPQRAGHHGSSPNRNHSLSAASCPTFICFYSLSQARGKGKRRGGGNNSRHVILRPVFGRRICFSTVPANCVRRGDEHSSPVQTRGDEHSSPVQTKNRFLAEFTLSPFAALRAVRKRRANGLGMTREGLQNDSIHRLRPQVSGSGLAGGPPRKAKDDLSSTSVRVGNANSIPSCANRWTMRFRRSCWTKNWST